MHLLMKKKRLTEIIGLLGLFILLYCFAGQKAETVVPVETESAAEVLPQAEENIDMTDSTEIAEKENVLNAMLQYGTADFYCGYPVDEAFLSWVTDTYGKENIEKLAGQLKDGKADAASWYRITGNSMHVLWMEYCRAHDYATYLYEDTVWKAASDSSGIRLDFIGDVNFDDNWHTMKSAEENKAVSACISDEIQKELKSADITMMNNEFAYTKKGEAQEGKEYSFRTSPEKVALLEIFGTDIVSVANNHVFDYGEKGFLDTLDTLKKAGIVYSGGGRNLEEATAAKYFIVKGRKIAIVSATEIERFSHYTKKAGENTPGVLKTQQTQAFKQAIQNAEKNSDYVIAYLHWGGEGKIHYDGNQAELAKLCVDAGADAVIGGHPHRLQGVEFIKDVPVAYSLGNFWFSNGTLYTTIAQIQIDEKGKLTLQMLPCIHRGVKTEFCKGEEKKEFYHYLADVSKNVGIDGSGRFYPYKDVDVPGESPYTYTSGRRYGQHFDDVDLNMKEIDVVGNLKD